VVPTPLTITMAPSYWALLRDNTEFRRLWLGVVVSFFGDWFTTIALYTAVQELTDSARAVAAVLIAKTLPIFLISPLAGPLVDRCDRRRLMIATDLGRAVLCLGLLGAWHLRSVELLLLTVFAQVTLAGVFIPARTAVIPQVTSDAEVPVAMALSGGTWSSMLALGAAGGGLVTALVGISGSFLVDGATFLLSAAFLWGLPPLPPRDGADAEAPAATFVEGLRLLSGRVYLPAVLALKSGLALAGGALVTIPLFGNGVFPATAGPAWVGLLFASRGMGALVGSLGVRQITGDTVPAMQRAIPPAFLVTGAFLLATSAAPSIGWAAAGLFLAAVGNGVIWVFSGTLGQRATERWNRGRLFSLEFAALTLVSASSSWVAGALVDGWGWSPREVIAAFGVAMVMPASAWTLVLLLAPDRPSERA
jgi:MFS family permease